MQLQLAMEERRLEVEAQRDLLRAELKAVTEDTHKTVLEKKDKAIKVAKVSRIRSACSKARNGPESLEARM